jgi:hypothetical protein
MIMDAIFPAFTPRAPGHNAGRKPESGNRERLRKGG